MNEKKTALTGLFFLVALSVVMFSTGFDKFSGTGNAYYITTGHDLGSAVVSVNVPRAEVYVDGKLTGNADYSGYIKINGLSRGYHTFTAKKTGYLSDTEEFFVNVGATTGQTVSLYLE